MVFELSLREHEICVDFLEVSNTSICKFEVVRIYANSSIVFAHVSIVPKWPFVVSREWSWVAYVFPECWFISVPTNFRFSICPLFSKGHAKIFRGFRHDLCYKLGHIECPGFAALGRSQHSCKTIVLFMSLFILLGLELID